MLLAAEPAKTAAATEQAAPAQPAPVAAKPTARQSAATESAPELPAAIDKLAKQILAALPANKPAKIAITPFVNLGPTAHEKKLGDVVAEMLVTRLTGAKPNLTIIERGQLSQVMEELKLSMLGLTEGSNAEKVGKLLGAEAMIVGSVSEVGDKFAISARHVDVETGQVAFAKEVLVPQAGTIALSSKYIVTKSRSDSLFRSLLIPGWGQYYNDQDAKGYVFTGVTVGLIGAAVVEHLAYKSTWDDYLNAKSKDKATLAYDKASNQRDQRDLIIGIAAGVWAVNVVDAFISGTSASEVHISENTTVKPVVAERADGTRLAMMEMKF
jgi:TolB-like protein